MKLFVTDYDNTLYTSDISIKENIKKLKDLKKKDFIIVISTGRSYPSIKEEIKKHHIYCDYISCCDGSIIYDNNGNIIDAFLLNKEIIQPILDFSEQLNYEEIQFSYIDGYSNIIKDNDLFGINIAISNQEFNTQIEKAFLDLKNKYKKYSFLVYPNIRLTYLCVKPKGISKSYAIKMLCQKFKVKKRDVFIIGDSANDLDMLIDFKGVGMHDSFPIILANVKKTYSSVAHYIDDILKN